MGKGFGTAKHRLRECIVWELLSAESEDDRTVFLLLSRGLMGSSKSALEAMAVISMSDQELSAADAAGRRGATKHLGTKAQVDTALEPTVSTFIPARKESAYQPVPIRTSEARVIYRVFKRFCQCFRSKAARVYVEKVAKAKQVDLGPPAEGRKTLVLDLDETLLHSSFQRFSSPDAQLVVPLGGTIVPIYIRFRPGMREFLAIMADLYDIVVFTASKSTYADPLLDVIDTDNFIRARLFREHCIKVGDRYIKDLRVLGRSLKSVVIVDDRPESFSLQPENAVQVSPFHGDLTDKELGKLAPVLIQLAQAKDVREFLRQSQDQSSSMTCAREGATVSEVQS